jgi:hypothetical protein
VLCRGGLRIGKEGLSIDQVSGVTAVSSQSEAAPVNNTLALNQETEQRLSEVRQAGISPVILEQQNRIRADLKKLGLTCSKDETIEILVRLLAINQISYAIERMYRLIFGSQIRILKLLNVYSPTRVIDIKLIYEEAKAESPKVFEVYSFEAYLNFLTSSNLIGTSDAQSYSISPFGKAFLQWMVMEGLPENKRF